MSNTPADYVANILAARTLDVEPALMAKLEGHPMEDGRYAEDFLDELPLSVERKSLVTITLGLGGPADWIDAVCIPADWGGLEVESATYTAVWGSDRKVTELRPTDTMWKAAQYYVGDMEA